MHPLIVLPLRTDKNRSQQAEGLVQQQRGQHARTHTPAPARRVRVRTKARSHLPSPLRGAGAWAVAPAAQLLLAVGHRAGSHSHPSAAALCRRLGAGSRQGTSSAAKAGVGWAQPGRLRQPSAGRAGGGAGHTQQRARGGRQHHSSPQASSLASGDDRQSLAISPDPPLPHLHTYIGVLGGPQQGWGGTARDGGWTAQSHA